MKPSILFASIVLVVAALVWLAFRVVMAILTRD